MKNYPVFPAAVDRRLTHQDQNQLRTLWFADGKTLPARVTKVEKDGIQYSTVDAEGFIKATDLCTADRVRYGFGTRKEGMWVEKMLANVAKQKSPHPTED